MAKNTSEPTPIEAYRLGKKNAERAGGKPKAAEDCPFDGVKAPMTSKRNHLRDCYFAGAYGEEIPVEPADYAGRPY